MTDQNQQLADIKDSYGEKYGFNVPENNYAFKMRKGLDRDIVAEISAMKGEPQWMLDFRLRAYDTFLKKPMPSWGGDLRDRKSTRLNSSHANISYAVFCL